MTTALTDVDQVTDDSESAPQQVSAPPRVNAAGWCWWCCRRWCSEVECIEHFVDAWWLVCDKCNGSQWVPDDQPCGCWCGMAERMVPHEGAVRSVLTEEETRLFADHQPRRLRRVHAGVTDDYTPH